MILFVPVFMVYFWATSIGPADFSARGTAGRLPRPWAAVFIIKALISAIPGAIIVSGFEAGKLIHEVLVAFGLVTLLSPLLVDSLGPQAGDPRQLVAYTRRWLRLQAESFISGLVVGTAVGAVVWLAGVVLRWPVDEWFQRHVEAWIGTVRAVPGHLVLPGSFYVVCFAVASTRITYFIVVRRAGALKVNVVVVCIATVLWYFYNTTLQLRMDDWSAPSIGLLGALIFGYVIDVLWAFIEG